MPHRIATIALTVRDYDEAIAFFVGVLGFLLVEDSDLGNGKRWVRVRPGGSAVGGGDGAGPDLLLARAVTEEQVASVGRQAGGRVFLFLETDDFERDYEAFRGRGVEFARPPRREAYGIVAVFRDVCGNLWDLIEPAR